MLLLVQIEDSWKEILREEFKKPYFSELQKFLGQEKEEGKIIYPEQKNIFHAFEKCSFHATQIVLLGQDPYHGKNQAHGLCFSVQKGVKIPPSLKNIYKELQAEFADFSIPDHGHLEKWAEQGILMMNSVLTVGAGAPASHAKKGWEVFTDAIIKKISAEKEGVIFVLWGKYAQEKGKMIDRTKHTILEAPHPSPFSAHSGFFGCNHFSEINNILQKKGEKEIEWQV